VRVEFHGSTISSDGGLLLFRELDELLGLHELMGKHMVDTQPVTTGCTASSASCASRSSAGLPATRT
jgi:hypothetical protein